MNVDHNYRVAALKLHHIHPKDKAWILGRLDPQQRAMLKELIIELKQLKLTSPEKINASFVAHPVANLPLNPELVSEINRADPETVFAALTQFPERIKALLLYATSWHWSAAVWDKFESYERSRLLRHINQLGIIKSAVFNCVTEVFADELKQLFQKNDRVGVTNLSTILGRSD